MSQKGQLFRSSFCKPHFLYTYRLISLLYVLAFTVWGTYASGSLFHNIRYLTYWGIYITLLYLIFVNSLTLLYIWKKEYSSDLEKHPKTRRFAACCRIALVLFEIAFALQPPIVLLFWTVVGNEKLDRMRNDSEFLARSINAHGGIFICMLVEFILNRVQFVLSHFLYLLAVLLAYIVNNYLHTLSGVKPVYKILDWKDFKSLFWILGGFFVIFLCFLILVYISSRKEALIKRKRLLAIDEDENLEYLAAINSSEEKDLEPSERRN